MPDTRRRPQPMRPREERPRTKSISLALRNTTPAERDDPDSKFGGQAEVYEVIGARDTLTPRVGSALTDPEAQALVDDPAYSVTIGHGHFKK